jgi:hypothetical protein
LGRLERRLSRCAGKKFEQPNPLAANRKIISLHLPRSYFAVGKEANHLARVNYTRFAFLIFSQLRSSAWWLRKKMFKKTRCDPQSRLRTLLIHYPLMPQ